MRRVVVAAAVVRGGRVLAARRTAPPEAAGRWELPGGKAEPGEPLTDALEREVAEELGCDIEVVRWLDGAAPIGESHELRVALARLVAGEPEPTEHDQLRWLAEAELTADSEEGVDWLEPDRPFLPQVAAALRQAAYEARRDTRRAIVFEEEHALLVQRQLRSDGFDAEVVRERLQGEDDDEDHPWAVVTDAPAFVVELLIDDLDGWLDEEQDAAPPGSSSARPQPPAPMDLPTAPRRLKRTDD